MKPKRKRFIPSKAETKNLNICFINPEKVKEQSLVKQGRPPPPLQITNNWEKLKQVITADTTSTGPRVRGKKRNREHQPSSGSAVTPKAISRSEKKRKVAEIDSSPRKRRRQSVKTPSTDEISTLAKGPQTIWFDDVDPSLLEYVERSSVDPGAGSAHAQEGVKMTGTESELVKPASFEGLTKAVAMDCEMVGVGSGSNNSMLARVSIVNSFGHCIYDTFVRPTEKVTDYRTAVSGVRSNDVKNAPSFEEVQKKVYAIVDQRILVGHALRNDLQVLYLSHPRKMIRDTARYKEFRKLFQGRTPSLKHLSDKVLGVRIQSGEHNSVEDARAAMRLYTMYKVQWEKQLSRNKHRDRTSSKRDEDGDKT